MRGWGGAKADQLPLKVCVEGGEAGGDEGRWSPPSSFSRDHGKDTGFEVQQTWVGGRRDLRTPQPSPQAPRARMHAGPPGQWGVLEAPRAPGPGQALAALVLAVKKSSDI